MGKAGSWDGAMSYVLDSTSKSEYLGFLHDVDAVLWSTLGVLLEIEIWISCIFSNYLFLRDKLKSFAKLVFLLCHNANTYASMFAMHHRQGGRKSLADSTQSQHVL